MPPAAYIWSMYNCVLWIDSNPNRLCEPVKLIGAAMTYGFESAGDLTSHATAARRTSSTSPMPTSTTRLPRHHRPGFWARVLSRVVSLIAGERELAEGP